MQFKSFNASHSPHSESHDTTDRSVTVLEESAYITSEYTLLFYEWVLFAKHLKQNYMLKTKMFIPISFYNSAETQGMQHDPLM